jgi:hypothetical protein
VVRKPHTLKCHVVTGMETKLACIKQASFFKAPLDYYFQNDFLMVAGPRFIYIVRQGPHTKHRS